jgi:hypothetical protein
VYLSETSILYSFSKIKNRPFTTGITVSDVNLSYKIFLVITGLPPRFYLHLGLVYSGVKGYVDVLFTTYKIETSCKKYFIILFTSGIFSTVVKGLLISHICTSGHMQFNDKATLKYEIDQGNINQSN